MPSIAWYYAAGQTHTTAVEMTTVSPRPTTKHFSRTDAPPQDLAYCGVRCRDGTSVASVLVLPSQLGAGLPKTPRLACDAWTAAGRARATPSERRKA